MTEEERDPWSDWCTVASFRHGDPPHVVQSLRRLLLEPGNTRLLTWDEYKVENNDQLTYSARYVHFHEGWIFILGAEIDVVQAVSRDLRAVVSYVKKSESGWTHTVFRDGTLLDEHSSHEDPGSNWMDMIRSIHGPRPTLAPGNASTIAKVFGVDESQVLPYLVHISRPEEGALALLTDGGAHRFAPPIALGDLRSPLNDWAFADLVARLGAPGINVVLRKNPVPLSEIWMATPRKVQPAPKADRDLDEMESEFRHKAEVNVDSDDRWVRFASASVLFGDDSHQSLPILFEMVREGDSVSGEAIRRLAGLWDHDLQLDLAPAAALLKPLEQAAFIRHLGSGDNSRAIHVLLEFLESPSLLVRLEAWEALAHVGNDALASRLLEYVPRAGPYERVVAEAACRVLGALVEDPEFACARVRTEELEDVPLRVGSLTIEHTLQLLECRVLSLLFLGALRSSPKLSTQLKKRYTEVGAVPPIEKAVQLLRDQGILVEVSDGVSLDPHVWIHAYERSSVPFAIFLEIAIRRSEGKLAIDVEGDTLRLRPSRFVRP